MSFIELIQLEQYNEAIAELEKNPQSKEDYYNLSLLYRLQDQYENEATLISKAIELYPEWDYMHERRAWHERPIFHHEVEKSKVVPRWPTSLGRDEKWKPSQAFLDQLCFVTTGDTNTFVTMVEMIESFRATKFYKDFPLCVLDVGFTDDQRHFLKEVLKVTEIHDPMWLIPDWIKNHPLQNYRGWYSANYSLSYFHKYFPKYRYHFHLESDTWIQSEHSIDRIAWLCEHQGWGKNCVNIAISCLDKESKYAQLWGEDTERDPTYNEMFADSLYVEQGLKYMMDIDGTAVDIVTQCSGSCVSEHLRGLINNNLIACTGMPVLKPGSNLLRACQTLEPIGILHILTMLSGITRPRDRFISYLWPTKELEMPLAGDEIKNHIEYTQDILSTGYDYADFPDKPKRISILYRVFPWQDKPEIKEMLLKGEHHGF